MDATNQMAPDASAIIAAAKKFGDSELVQIARGDDDSTSVIVLPEGRKVQSLKPLLDEYLAKPERRKGTAAITTLQSFIDHVNRHKDDDSVVFAHVTATEAQLLAVFDYNLKGPAGPEGGARFGQHRAVYGCPFSDEWKAWTGKDGKGMAVAEFAEFLEDRIMDVLAPGSAGESIKAFAEQLGVDMATPQRLMELSRGLAINVGQNVVNTANLSTGEGVVSFAEKHAGEGGAALKVPGAFVLAIPVFKNSKILDQVAVRLRYRVANQNVTWTFALSGVDRVRDTAIEDACNQVVKETALPLFYGKPEA